MPEKKSIPLIIILTIVTCGIYYYVWMYQFSDEIGRFTGDRSTSPGTEVLLTIVTCGIYGLYWLYKYSKKMWEISINVGVPYPSDNAILNLVLGIFGFSIVSMAIMQTQLHTIWDQTFFNPNQGGPNPNQGDPYNPYNGQ
ncbi:DUF4234 domain-containing protein [Zongyangia hominis]|nr:DUF4234 domain-containing protein [Zongyangia hominis]